MLEEDNPSRSIEQSTTKHRSGIYTKRGDNSMLSRERIVARASNVVSALKRHGMGRP